MYKASQWASVAAMVAAGMFALGSAACFNDPGDGDNGDNGSDADNSSNGDNGAYGASSAGFKVNGKLVAGQGKTIPATASVKVLWGVSAGSPDYVYAFGPGTSTGASFSASFAVDPPADALNEATFGVGMPCLYTEGKAPADGKLASDADVLANMLGAAGQYAVIFKAKDAPQAVPWLKDFPTGYSCGKGVPAPTGETFDSFTPVDCATVEINVDDIDNIQFVNWT